MAVIWALIKKSIKPTLTGLTPTHEEILNTAREFMEDTGAEDFTVYDLVPRLNFSKTRLHDLIRELEAFGYLEKVDGGPGKKNRYRIFDLEREEDEFTAISAVNSEEFFSKSELSDWLDRLFHFSTEDKEKIFLRFYSNIYNPLSDSEDEGEDRSTTELGKYNVDLEETSTVEAYSHGDSKNIFTPYPPEKWKVETEGAEDSNSGDEDNEFTAEIRVNSEESSAENKDNEAISNIANGDKIKYVRIRMIKPVPFSKELIGSDGKFYTLPEVGEEITLPEDNAEPILRYGYAMKVGDGL